MLLCSVHLHDTYDSLSIKSATTPCEAHTTFSRNVRLGTERKTAGRGSDTTSSCKELAPSNSRLCRSVLDAATSLTTQGPSLLYIRIRTKYHLQACDTDTCWMCYGSVLRLHIDIASRRYRALAPQKNSLEWYRWSLEGISRQSGTGRNKLTRQLWTSGR